MVDAETAAERRTLLAAVARFQTPSLGEGIAQFATSLLAFVALEVAMYAALDVSVWLTLALAPLAAGMTVRLFIVQHDCGHGSFFRTRRANAVMGWMCSLFTYTPFACWRRQHAQHHASFNNLDRRDTGLDIYSTCATAAEYAALPLRRRLLYRLSRHPALTLFVLPPLAFLLLYRIPFDTPRGWRRERRSVHLTNLALAVTLGGLALACGWRAVLIVQLPIAVLSSIAGAWLFSVQHRFEAAQWARQPEWSATGAALDGSSYLRLPRVLQWFTGNIGFHHIHHLSARVPNYRLQACHEASESLARVTTLSLRDALTAPCFALWDEAAGRMVRFPARRRGAGVRLRAGG
jgi:omega-6 fatty acid desaturase (delta-12 desaturase)